MFIDKHGIHLKIECGRRKERTLRVEEDGSMKHMKNK
jgi:hypothetical protein